MQSDSLTSRRGARIWLAISLVAALAAMWLSQRSGSVEVRELVLSRFPTSDPHPGWIAEITLDGDGYPLLVHLDEEGWPVILYPERSLARLPAHRSLWLPDPARGVTWAWPESIAAGDVMAAATRRRGLDLEELRRRLQREAARAPTAAEARARVREVLQARVGPVRTAVFGPDTFPQVAGHT
jgi:hypothetical protein